MTNVTQFPKAEAPRQMSPADRRRVFREIDENWDEGKARYSGSATDQTLAVKLDVPRAWVEEIRREAFGDSGRNADFDKILGNLQNMRGEAERNAATALDLAARYEQMSKDYAALVERLKGVV